MEKIEDLNKMLVTSLTMEKEGYDFYKDAAKKCASEFGKKVFNSLAEDEQYHAAAISKFYLTYTREHVTPLPETILSEAGKSPEKMLFGKSSVKLLEGISRDTDEFKAYEFAMKFENEGYEFYKKTFETLSDPHAKELYKFLIGEEKAHCELIADTCEYLKDPAAWFAKEEKPIVEG